MKKIKVFAVMATSLFIIGMVGLICFYCFVQKPLDNYFAFIIILVIATLPKTLLEFFSLQRNLHKRIIFGYLRLIFFYMTFVILTDSIFPKLVDYLIFPRLVILAILFFWGMSYYRKHPTDENDLEPKT